MILIYLALAAAFGSGVLVGALVQSRRRIV